VCKISESYIIVIVFQTLQLKLTKKFKIKSIFEEVGFKKLSKLEWYFWVLVSIFGRGGESRIHGNSIKSAYVLKKNISITPCRDIPICEFCT